MKPYISFVLSFVCIFTLTSCAVTQKAPRNFHNYQETWMYSIERDSARFTQGADDWFLKDSSIDTSSQSAMRPLQLKVPNFVNIKVNGNFQVRIFGTDDHNSVNIYGPNNKVRAIAVRIINDTLYLGQATQSPAGMNQVIVRIGVKYLNKLIQEGASQIEGIQLYHDPLNVYSTGSGPIYLSGNLNAKCIYSNGKSKVTLLGVVSRKLDVVNRGFGSINISGKHVGVRFIKNSGKGNINIIGASTPHLVIDASNCGRISILGNYIRLHAIRATDAARVYLYAMNSDYLNAYVFDNAKVGLAGFTQKLNLDTYQHANFLGTSLCSEQAYVRAFHQSHINFWATQKAFAKASGSASIYFRGPRNILTAFTSQNGVILPVN